ncbi:unnamed protein product [Sphagnum jensenii]|uniref:Uncharacterized protein n=1 Tax=Sphagnum jensenii TaxID=128206 RepID=A0ABP0VHR1_9BRYO
MSCAVGASSGGSLIELVALGAADTYLTMNPSITFWRFRYNKHTNFTLESIQQCFNVQPAFGATVQVTLNRVGDLVYWMFLVIDLPGIRACTSTTPGACGVGFTTFPAVGDPCNACGDVDDGLSCPQCPLLPDGSAVPDDIPTNPLDNGIFDTSNVAYLDENGFVNDVDTCTGLTGPWAHWVNDIGHFVCKFAQIVIGGQVIDTIYNDYLFIWEELSGQPGKRLTEMTGRRFTRSQLVEDAKIARRLYVPLKWWFTQISGNALPLVSLQFHGVQIFVCFEELVKCVQVSTSDVVVVKCGNCSGLVNADLSASLDTTYVYLDVEERDRFATGSFEQLITQVQFYSIATTTSQVHIPLQFNHPIIELIWVVRRECQKLANNHFNYSGFLNQDPVATVSPPTQQPGAFLHPRGPLLPSRRALGGAHQHSRCLYLCVLLRPAPRRCATQRFVQLFAHRQRRTAPRSPGQPHQRDGNRAYFWAQLECVQVPRRSWWTRVREQGGIGACL